MHEPREMMTPAPSPAPEPAKNARGVYRPAPISGFPELTPEWRAVEMQWLDALRGVYQSYGYGNIETPAVESLDALLAKGETDKEIYALHRLQAETIDPSEARLGLHYDLTVPFARYVAQHFGSLVFPFKRWQAQKVWRGERPQAGRFREFLQADCDVIAQDSLPMAFDAEMPHIMGDAFAALKVGDARLHVSNRKILSGYLAGLDITDTVTAIRWLDKLDKIGAKAVAEQIAATCGVTAEIAAKAVALAEIRAVDSGFVRQVTALGVVNPVLQEGLDELAWLFEQCRDLPDGFLLADLSVARGFDYYTGTVMEARLISQPSMGSIGGGGRYDDLVGGFINRKLPGVGVTIGVSRLFHALMAKQQIQPARFSPTQILVVLPDETRRDIAQLTARTLRARGFAVEVFASDAKLKRQLTYAERLGIPHVWFPPFEDGQPHEVKNMVSGAQSVADASVWMPEDGE